MSYFWESSEQTDNFVLCLFENHEGDEYRGSFFGDVGAEVMFKSS